MWVSCTAATGAPEIEAQRVAGAGRNGDALLIAHFQIRVISQSSSSGGADNELTISFQFNANLKSPTPASPAAAVASAASSPASLYTSITITGLDGARASSSASALMVLGEGDVGTSAARMFSGSNVVFEAGTAHFEGGSLFLWLLPGVTLSSGEVYSVKLPITNPSYPRAAAAPTIQASGGVIIPPQPLTIPVSNLSYYRRPLLVDRVSPPEFVPELARTCVDSCELTLRTRTEGATIYYAWNSTSASIITSQLLKKNLVALQSKMY